MSVDKYMYVLDVKKCSDCLIRMFAGDLRGPYLKCPKEPNINNFIMHIGGFLRNYTWPVIGLLRSTLPYWMSQ